MAKKYTYEHCSDTMLKEHRKFYQRTGNWPAVRFITEILVLRAELRKRGR